ncbi:2Fe-2S iron-sulfur cluster-binding protein, partial [Thermodesulfobacteriota bacterium]
MKTPEHTERKKWRHSDGFIPAPIQRVEHVWLNVLPDDRWFKVRRGSTIGEALRPTEVELEGDCGGLGKCGKCRIRIISAMDPTTKDEIALLDEDEVDEGIRLACLTRIEKDLIIDVGRADKELEHFQILKTGLRPLLQLDPLLDQRIVSSPSDPDLEWLSDLDRIKLALGPEYQDLKAPLHCLRALPDKVKRANFDGAVVLHDKTLLSWQDWGK